jgi:hypothetical protein
MKRKFNAITCLMSVSLFVLLPSTSFSAKTTDDISEGIFNLYYTQARFDASLSGKTTDALAEGSVNLYWSDTLFNQALAGKTTDDLSEGISNFYYTQARFDASLSAKTTDDIAEGVSRFYYTQARFDSSFSGKTSDNLSEGDSNFYYTEDRFDESLGNKTTDDLTEGANNKYSPWSESNSDIYYTGGFVGIGTPNPGEQLTVDGAILIRPASSVDNDSPAIIAQSNDDFLYDDDYINHYAMGFHFFNGGLNAYVSSYAGVDIFTGGARRFRINGDGNVLIGNVDPLNAPHPLQLESGAHVTAGGVWTDASSLQFKQDVVKLGLKEAQDALLTLNPVLFRYKAAPQEQYAGFIAEEVPELVSMQGRKGLSPMDIVAVLTKVVQNQQKEIEILKEKLDKIEANNKNS